MSITFTLVPGSREVLTTIRDANRLTERALRQGWFEVGDDWKRATSDEILRRPKGGRTYIIRSASGRRRRHVASAPGETHANITGKTRRSLGYSIRGFDEMTVGYGVSGLPTSEWGPALEFGTRKMAARPSIQNGIRAVTRNAERSFGSQIVRAFNEGR